MNHTKLLYSNRDFGLLLKQVIQQGPTSLFSERNENASEISVRKQPAANASFSEATEGSINTKATPTEAMPMTRRLAEDH